MLEASINWEDDDTVIGFTLDRRKEDDQGEGEDRQERRDEFQFKVGVALIPTECLDSVRRNPTTRRLLSYERARLPNNPYHGNILLLQTVEKKTRVQIAGTIASFAEIILRPAAK
ncbi:MAG: hypothetical protein AB1646_07365 [Thermodesulfobacteriota bacterium]